MKLCIAEKPSVGKELARILGANSRRDGYFEGNGYYVSWTFGHLCSLKAPDDYTDAWKRWSLSGLPMIPQRFQIKVIEENGVQKQFNTLKSLIEKSVEIINCGDAGIEGELIQRWVLSLSQCNKPVKRLWISSLTDEAIKDGFAHLRDSKDFDLLYAAGNARAIGDWLLGMNASRLYTVKYANSKGVLSIGRVQTPTLALIVNRHNEIMNFVPETYWELKTKYRDVIFNSTKRKFATVEEGHQLLESIKDKEFEIVSSTKKKGNEQPPALFDLTSLQVECNKKFNFTADDTLKYIQKLYEQKLVTYPRVDTTYLPDNMHGKVKDILLQMKPYEKFTKEVTDKPIRKNKKVFDDSKITDHHAIIPTGIAPGGGLALQEKQVYDTIARRFIAAFYPDCVVSNTTVIGNVDGNEFSATGKVILEEGWRMLYPKKDNDALDDENAEMPVFNKGEKGPHFPDLLEKQTQPPKYYTEATLLRAMETAGKQVEDPELRDLMKENGIGRPSTRANIIETLFKRSYIYRQKKNLIPTITGIELIKTINNELLKSVELTGLWEKKLRQIEKGEYDARNFLTEMKQMVADLVVEVIRENFARITITEDNSKKPSKQEQPKADEKKVEKESKTTNDAPVACPKCKKGTIVKGKSAFGCSAFKDGCNFRIAFDQFGKKLTDKQIFTLIEKKKTPKIKGFVKENQKVNGTLVLTSDFTIDLKVEAEKEAETPQLFDDSKFICPQCKKGTLLKGNKAWGCDKFREGCRFIIPFDELLKKFNTTDLTRDIFLQITKP
ncbi:MAG TPA: DNA topoisomerase 3 [Bacteroidales bacterium]|nr:DNA topoisomerase 3 [Bacteroidales bacterium]